jgi:3-hydroxybutyryl-CoA dehydrogenase
MDRRVVMARLGRVTVVGSGRMAPGIAAACAAAGCEVVVAARDEAKARSAARLAGEYSGKEVGSGPLAAEAVAEAECVVETIVEDLDTKRDLFGRLVAWIGPTTVLATNTSSFPITSLAESVEHPGRVAGLHFLNPAHETAVVEVIAGERTHPDTVDALAELGVRMGKTPLVVHRDVKGFIWNRLQLAVLREALFLLEEGVADIASIDAAVSDGLAPRWVGSGPFATADLGGIQTWAVVAGELFPVLSNEAGVPDSLRDRAECDGGFYDWSERSAEELARLRAEALRAAMQLIEQRRAAMPAATDSTDRG